jgi:hypothetical protein
MSFDRFLTKSHIFYQDFAQLMSALILKVTFQLQVEVVEDRQQTNNLVHVRH